MEHNDNNLIHITLLSILVFVFFALMFLSTSTKNIEIKYQFLDQVKIKENNYNVKVGEVYIKNSGFLSSKINLDLYKGCIFDEESLNYQYGFDLNYPGVQTTYNDFNGYSPKQSIEIDKKSEDTYTINLNGFYPYQTTYDEKGILIENNQITKDYELYVFKIDPKDVNYYNYCMNAKKTDAIKMIKLTQEETIK